MAQNPETIRKRHNLYQRLWARSESVYHPELADDVDNVHIDVYVFRPTWRFWAPARRYFVYITGGLSDSPCRSELMTFAGAAPDFGQFERDLPAKWLMRLARTAVKNRMTLAPGDTFDCGEPLTAGSEMTGFYFANPMFVDPSKLREATVEADAVAHVIPISAAECRLASKQGAVALVEAFGAHLVEPVFDAARCSCV